MRPKELLAKLIEESNNWQAAYTQNNTKILLKLLVTLYAKKLLTLEDICYILNLNN